MTATEQTGRFRQRRRTRAAIVAAATELLREGRTPSVNDVAERADVSRRTVYQYFPTLEQLLIDATLGMLSQAAVDEAIEAADAGTHAGVDERVTAMIRALNGISHQTMPLGRSLIRLTVDPPAPGGRRVAAVATADSTARALFRHSASSAAGSESATMPPPARRRGYRRVAWLERALEPLRPQLDDAGFERLVSGLAMVVGWEALIVLQDLRGLSRDEQVETSVWAARALIRSALS